MNSKSKAPCVHKPTPRALNTITKLDKDTTIHFKNPHRQRVYELFLTGEKLTTVSATVKLRIPDVTSHIRYLRQAGIAISDYWVKTKFSKYKVYFLAGSAIPADKNPGGRHEEII